MKKLLIAVSAAACALGAFAALGADSKVTFEEAGYTVNNPLDLTKDDAGQTDTDAKKWYSATPADVDATVMAYATAPAEGNNNYLNIESTGKPLYRLIHGMATPDVAGATTETMGEVYIDTMVQFTAGDPDMTSDETGAKLALWVCGNNAEGDPASETNFMVKAGCFDGGTFTSGIYEMAAPEGVTFEKDAWYRLTVKTMKDVYTGADDTPYHGFVVFVDGQMLKPQNYSLPEGVSVSAKFKDGLVLSMIEDNPRLAAVGFSGTGAIDDVTFTATAPEFAADAQTVTLTWTAGVTSLVYGDWSTNVTEAGSATVPFVADTTVTVTYVDGYMAGATTGDLAVGGTYGIVAVPVAATVDGTTYATLEAAIAAANGKTVVLNGNATFEYDDETFAGQLMITNAVTLDLAGHEILPKVAEELVITVGEPGSLTITNSTETVGYVRGTIENNGADANALTLVGGKYLTIGLPTDNYVVPAPFEAQELADADAGYTQIVVATEEPKPTVITIVDANVTLSAESATYTGSSVAPTVTVVVNETTLVAGTDYDVTIPEIVDAGSYTITVTGKDSYEGTVSKIFTVAAKAITPTLTLSATAGVLGSEGLALPTVTVADGDATLDAANYDLAWNPSEITAAGDYVVTVTLKGNYSGSNTATFTVTAPAPVVTPVTPGSEGATVTAGSADAAKDAVTITAPTGIDATGYQGLFNKVAANNGNGTWTVTAELTVDAETAIKADADVVVTNINLTAAAAVADDGTLAPIAAEDLTPGIYYSVEVADNLGFTGGQEGDRVMAGANGTANIPMPNPKALENANGNARFFRVKANVKDK